MARMTRIIVIALSLVSAALLVASTARDAEAKGCYKCQATSCIVGSTGYSECDSAGGVYCHAGGALCF